MPNWCSNEITITGKPKMLNKLLKQVESLQSETDEPSRFDFNLIVPMPDGVDWYSWRIENWGTKWNASDVGIANENSWEEGVAHLWFETAWSPPVPVLEKLSKDNPKVTITHKFVEEGMGFYGTYEYNKGKYEVVEEDNFNDNTPCEVYYRYKGDDYHHYCRECEETFDCDGEPSKVCPECEASLNETDKELWEGEEDECNHEVKAS